MSMQHGEGEFRVVLTEPDGRELSGFGTWIFDSPESQAEARKTAIAQAQALQDRIGNLEVPQPYVEGSRYRVLRVEATVVWDARQVPAG